MTDFVRYHSVTHPMITVADYNYRLDHAYEKTASYIVRVNGAYYEAILGGGASGCGTIAFGGVDNAGGVDGTDLNAVQVAADAQIATDGGGVLYLKDLALDSGVTVSATDHVIQSVNGTIKSLIHEDDSQNSPYYITYDGTKFYCQDRVGSYVNSYTSTSLSTTLDSVLDVAPEYKSFDVIFNHQGVLPLDATVTIPTKKTPVFIGLGQNITGVTLNNNVNDHMFEYDGADQVCFITFKHMYLDGNSANQAAGDIIHFNDKPIDVLLFDCFFYDAYRYNVYLANAWNNRILYNTFEAAGDYALYLDAATKFDAKVHGNKFLYNKYGLYNYAGFSDFSNNWFYMNNGTAIWHAGGESCIYSSNRFYENGETIADAHDMVIAAGTRVTVTDNMFHGSNQTNYGIYVVGTITNCIITDNVFYSHQTGHIRLNITNDCIIRDNHGFITENSGSSAIAAADTSVAVAHGCSYTPSAKDVTITQTAATTNPCYITEVDTFGAANFTVHCNAVPGVSTLAFDWAVRKV